MKDSGLPKHFLYPAIQQISTPDSSSGFRGITLFKFSFRSMSFAITMLVSPKTRKNLMLYSSIGVMTVIAVALIIAVLTGFMPP